MNQFRKQKKLLDNYARYSSIGFQMLFIILAGVFGGYKLDQWLNLRFPIFTVILSMLSVSFAIYYAVRDFTRTASRKDPEEKSKKEE